MGFEKRSMLLARGESEKVGKNGNLVDSWLYNTHTTTIKRDVIMLKQGWAKYCPWAKSGPPRPFCTVPEVVFHPTVSIFASKMSCCQKVWPASKHNCPTYLLKICYLTSFVLTDTSAKMSIVLEVGGCNFVHRDYFKNKIY